MTTQQKLDKAVDDVAGNLNKLMEKSFGHFEAVSFNQVEEEDLIFVPSDFLDLNRIMTGDLFGFMPPGNIVVLAGKEASGKSLVGYNFLRNAQSMGILPVLFETESAINKNTFNNAGIVSQDGGLVVRLGYVEQAIIAFDKVVNDFVKAGIPIAICLDSLGNLGHEKTVKDIAKGELKQDMGMFQKSLKAFLKHACHLCAAHKIPFVIVTHIFFDPSPYGGGAKVYGGQHLKFLANTSAMFDGGKKQDDGTFQLRAKTIKNRLCPPFQNATIDIDIRTSQVNRYAGMVELAKDLEIFEKAGSYVYLPHLDKKMYASEIYKNAPDIFTPEVLGALNDKLRSTSYDTISFDDGSPGDMIAQLEAGSKADFKQAPPSQTGGEAEDGKPKVIAPELDADLTDILKSASEKKDESK